MGLIALAILKDLSNNTVGALISVDGKHIRFKTCDILDLKKNGITLENAVIDINGFVRSKKGKLDTTVIKDGEKINPIEQNEIRNAQKLIKKKASNVYKRLNKDWTKDCCYSVIDFKQDFSVMGFFFERIKEAYCKGIDIEWFVGYFMDSLFRYCQEEGDYRLNNMDSAEMFSHFMIHEKPVLKYGGPKFKSFSHYELYWIGQAYAYLHYKGDIRSRDLVRLMPFQFMREAYITGHQLEFSGFYDRCKWMIEDYKKQNNIDYNKEDFEDKAYLTRKFVRNTEKE